jgi:hypothetical protein
MSYYSYDTNFNYPEYENDDLYEYGDDVVPYKPSTLPALYRRKRITRAMDSVLDGMFHVLFLFLFLNFFFLTVIGPSVEKASRDSLMRTFYNLVPDIFGDLTQAEVLTVQALVVPYSYANSQDYDIREITNERLMDTVTMFFLVMVIAIMPICFWYVMNNKTHRLVKIFVFSIVVLAVFGISEGLLYVFYLQNVRNVSEEEQTANMLRIVREHVNELREIPEKKDLYNEIQNEFSRTHWQPIISIIVISTLAVLVPLVCCVIFYPSYINPSSYRFVEQLRKAREEETALRMMEYNDWLRANRR